MNYVQRTREHGIGVLLVIATVALVGVVAGGAAAVYLVLEDEGRPPEQTAKYLPDETQVYFSVNLEPGTGQLRHIRDILLLFRENPGFQRRVDDFVDDAEAETGIDFSNGVLPWLGPEFGVGVIDVVGSAVAGFGGGPPIVVALAGTTDRDRAQRTLDEWVQYQEGQFGGVFDTDTYRGLTVRRDPSDFQHYTIAGDYVVFATDRALLEDTVDRILDENTEGSLFNAGRFQTSRRALPGERLGMLFVDSEDVWLDARRQVGSGLTSELRRWFDDMIPEWTAMAATLVDNGVELVIVSAETGGADGDPPLVNSLDSADLLPADTLGFLSFALDPDLAPLREELRGQRIGDLGEGVSEGMSELLEAMLTDDDTLEAVLDALLDRAREATNIDFEKEVLQWMAGEFSLAVLPWDFAASFEDPTDEAIRGMALLRFKESERRTLDGMLGKIDQLIEERAGLKAKRISYCQGKGAIFPVGDPDQLSPYDPGYLVLGEHVIVATTAEDLELSASLHGKGDGSLSKDREFSRLERRLPKMKNPLLYLDLRGIVSAVVDGLDPDQRSRYRQDVEPFVGPLLSFMLAGDVKDGRAYLRILLTVE